MALQSPPTILLLNKHLTKPTNPLFSSTRFTSPGKIRFLCAKNPSDSDLAFEFAAEAAKLNTQEVQRKDALKRSKSLLFQELCKYMSLESDDLKKKWSKMSEDDKSVLAKDFVSNWASHFHPLSARSVKELVDEYLVHQIPASSDSSAPKLFSVLRRFMGFSEK